MHSQRVILVVDDDSVDREPLMEILQEIGYIVEGAATGRDALARLIQMEVLPSLILLELTLPDISGPEFRREQGRQPGLGSIPVMVLSAHADIAGQARKMGAVGWLEKPLNLGRLLEVIELYCGGSILDDWLREPTQRRGEQVALPPRTVIARSISG